jgi:drug/metabolite transporter (DMT)-like permease
MTFLLLRCWLAVTIFGLIFVVKHRPLLPRAWRVWRDMVIVGLSLLSAQLLFGYSAQHLSSGVVSLFVTLIPIFTAAMAYYFAAESFNWRVIAGIIIAFIGVLAILLSRTNGLDNQAVNFTGYWQALLAAFIGAFTGVYMRRHLKRHDVTLITAVQMLTCAVLLVPAVVFLNQFKVEGLNSLGWASIIFSATAGSVAAFWLITYLTKHYGATVAALQTYIVPVTASALGVVLLAESLSLIFVLALGVVLLGVGIASYQRPANPTPTS